MKYFMYDIYHIVNFQTVTRKRKVTENDNSDDSAQSTNKKKQVKIYEIDLWKFPFIMGVELQATFPSTPLSDLHG